MSHPAEQPGLNNYRQNSPGDGMTAGAIPDLTMTRIDPGICTSISCTWTGGNGDGVVTVDDRGNGTGTTLECREDNNSLAVAVSCP